jgi:hypothetical protein
MIKKIIKFLANNNLNMVDENPKMPEYGRLTTYPEEWKKEKKPFTKQQ